MGVNEKNYVEKRLLKMFWQKVKSWWGKDTDQNISASATNLSTIVETITNPTSCLHHLLPHPDLMQLHLGLDPTKDRPPVQSDIVPSCNNFYGLSHYQKRTANS